METIPLLEYDGRSYQDLFEFGMISKGERPDSECEQYLVFFVPGNPGLPQFYTHFLSTLASMFKGSQVSTPRAARLCIAHLAGFQGSGTPFSATPISLQDQILYTESQLSEAAKNFQRPGSSSVKIILIGHSVGSYIVLEMLRRRHVNQRQSEPNLEIRGGILLFPTIIDLAKSPLGRLLSPLVRMPYTAILTGCLVWSLTLFLPWAVLYNILRWIFFFPPYAAAAASDFVKSPHGIAQTLYLAREEMNNIEEDRWGSEVWGAKGQVNPPLVLLFGKNDGLVGQKIQDTIVQTRSLVNCSTELWRPRVFSAGIPHAFCISEKHSKTIATRAYKWIDEMVGLES